MPPVLAAAGIAALGGGILQYLNSEAARKASAAEIQRVEALYNKIQQPNFDVKDFSPEDFKVVQQYAPEHARFVQEAAPTTVKADTQGAVAGREAQMSALNRLRQVGAGQDPFQQAAIEQAQRQSAQSAEAQRQSILQGYQRRGLGGSGLELASQLGATSNEMDRGATAGLQGGMAQYQQGLQAVRDSANLGGQIRGEDVSLEGQNAGIINQFNQRNAANQQQYANQQADTNNSAQRQNIAQAQNTANENVSQHNAAALGNQQRRNQYADTTYQNALGMARSQAGLSNDRRNNIIGNAADKNQAIQGVTNVAVGAAENSVTPKYNPYTGAGMYDSQTGVQYGAQKKDANGNPIPPTAGA